MAKPKTLESRFGMRGNLRGKPRGRNQSIVPEDSMRWLEIERWEGSVTLSRDQWFGQKAVFKLSGAISALRPKSRSEPDDRAFVVAKKRVTIVERRDAGKVEA